ncbi:DUF309 domain-containing protein [Pseudalkalibacillus berkeleyi]|uniref:DUF309 domain-containing protein n=1 Tax=Pseudalkalibacillus berkeleyi TaxID=1069813 RepID=A0ABS9GY74_9BACL|nr:DUF309 domain-containing protein [Pseudalkalibacillus berkeleyi]MCF6137634.1 DUF309 domain-containing protein [Pseudalkalibacillus berkeleyi]
MYPKAYIDYLVHFHGLRDYFECHEILEEYWKSVPKEQEKHHWVGLIQIAVALYHQRRNNFSGAKRMMKSALNIVETNQSKLISLGIDVNVLMSELRTRLNEITNQQPYHSFNFPLLDKDLRALCEQKCQEIECTYGMPSDLDNDYLIHKHTLRDRKPVIKERLEQHAIRKKKREG